MRALRYILAGAVVAGAGVAWAGGEAGSQPAAAGEIAIKRQYWFGVAVENIPPAISKQLQLKPDQGLMVFMVLPKSPAEKAGLQAEDILIEINAQALTSQEDLFRAANPVGKSAAAGRSNSLTYLRGGKRTTVEITPARRPGEMIVFDSPSDKQHNRVVNYVAPTGGGAQVGPGYRVDLNTGDAGSFAMKSIKSTVSKGQTVVLSQETDAAGHVKNTISVGGNSYGVEAGKLDALPAEIRPLAEQLIRGETESEAVPAATEKALDVKSMEQRLKELESRNAELQQRLEQLEKNKSK